MPSWAKKYPMQVGDQDFAIDLVFYNRNLNYMVAIELEIEKFKPEQLGQLNFYLEALGRDVKKKPRKSKYWHFVVQWQKRYRG